MTDQAQLDAQKEPEKALPPGGTRPRRSTRVRTDEAARCVIELLAEIAARVKHEPATKPPPEGMVKVGAFDRAAYHWFLPCPEGTVDSQGEPVELCNSGVSVSRSYGAYEVRAWAHGAAEVHDVVLHTHRVTREHLETAAQLVGLPLKPVPVVGALDMECPVCLQGRIRHDGLQLETHKTPLGHVCHGSGWKIVRRDGR